MPIAASDIKLYLSGGSGNTDPNASIGGARSTSTQITSASLQNLFANVPGAEATPGSVKYRCFYVRNEHASLTYQAVKAFIQTLTASGNSEIDIGLDPAGVNGTAASPANETTAPAGVTFSRPTTLGAALSIGDLAVNAFQAIWVRRTIDAAAAAINVDNCVIRHSGDTAA
jgi:hypothetical protein